MARVSGSISLVMTGSVSIALRVLTVPLYLVWLGEDQYSLYLYMLFLTGFVALFNPHVDEAAITRLTEAFAKGETERAWRIQQAFTALTLLIAGVGLVAFAAMAFLVPVPDHRLAEVWPMFLCFGLAYAGNVLAESLHPVLYAQDKFQQLAVREFFVSTGGAIAGIGLVWAYRTPVALAAVTALNAVVGYLLLLVITKRLYPEFRVRPRWIPDINRDLFRIGLRGYLHRAALMVSTTIDKILLPHALPMRQLAHYHVPAQVPVTLQRMMDPIQNTLRPELTRQGLQGAGQLAESTTRFARIVLGIACCTVLVPAAFGLPILLVWLPEGVSMPFGAAVMLALGVACTLELLHGVFNMLAYAIGKPHVLVPVSGLNAAATVAFTVPVALAFGVAGVAVQNGLLFALLLPALLWTIRRHCTPDLDMRDVLRSTAASMGVGLFYAIAAFTMCHHTWFRENPWVALGFGPFFMLACWFTLRKFGLTPHVHLPKPLRSLEFPDAEKLAA